MQDEQIKKLIQENLENCWRQFGRTRYMKTETIHTTGSKTLCTNSGTFEPLLNSVISFVPSPTKLYNDIAEIEHFYLKMGVPFCWWIAKDALFDQIESVLTGQGFRQTMEVKGMALDINSIPLTGSFLDNLRVVHVKTHQDFVDWMNVLRAAFDMDQTGADRYRNMLEELQDSTDAFESYVAYQDDQPVSSLTLFLDKKVASFYNVGTLPSCRGQGLGTAMAMYTLDIAKKKGYTWATLQANTNSVGMYSRMGFRSLIDYRLYFK